MITIPAASLDRFLRYVRIDTQSDPESPTIPSTAKQKDLARVLVEELHSIGIADAALDEWGYVYATIPATIAAAAAAKVPVICFCSHMDTSPDSSGKDVKPLVHANYQGGKIALPDNPNIVIDPAEHPELLNQIGNDIVTASGTTLLGADNKAGLAAIMAATEYLAAHPEIPHGTIRILFTPDEEIGRGVDKVDMVKLGAHFGYTIDGETRGHIEDETFSADAAVITIDGVSSHPGFALGKMESAIKIAADIVATLPKDRLSPETTSGKEGFLHPLAIEGAIERAKLTFIVRDFTTAKLLEHEQTLRTICDTVIARYPRSRYTMTVTEQYRNMKEVLDRHPEVTAHAEEAVRRAGITPHRQSIRGGTDGSRLSFMGLPCPNIFAGEHAFHSKYEWVSIQDMQKAAETVVHLAMIWAE